MRQTENTMYQIHSSSAHSHFCDCMAKPSHDNGLFVRHISKRLGKGLANPFSCTHCDRQTGDGMQFFCNSTKASRGIPHKAVSAVASKTITSNINDVFTGNWDTSLDKQSRKFATREDTSSRAALQKWCSSPPGQQALCCLHWGLAVTFNEIQPCDYSRFKAGTLNLLPKTCNCFGSHCNSNASITQRDSCIA